MADLELISATIREQVAKTFDSRKHPRYPRGHPKGGQFMPTDDVTWPSFLEGLANEIDFPTDADPQTQRAIRKALTAINKVHGVRRGGVRRFPITLDDSQVSDTADGTTQFDANPPKREGELGQTWVKYVALRRNGPDGRGVKPTTVVHEMGHVVDGTVLQDGNTGVSMPYWTISGEAETFFRAVAASDSIQRLLVMQRVAQMAGGFAPLLVPDGEESSEIMVSEASLRYLLDPREIFARAYAQWVARRSGVIKETDFELDGKPLGYYPDQWDSDDFTPIAEELDRAFARRGLVHKPNRA